MGSPTYGLCKCGCGDKTSIALLNRKNRGWVRGKPIDYLPNHHVSKGHRIITKDGYVKLWEPTHPRSSGGYVFEHILIVEKALGRHLQGAEEVHHVNEMKGDNRNNNLVLCPDVAYHQLLHKRLRAYNACGNSDFKKCKYCKQWDDPVDMKQTSYLCSNKKYSIISYDYHHKACVNSYRRTRTLTKKNANL